MNIGLEIVENEESLKFIEGVKTRLAANDLVKNPFYGKVIRIKEGQYIINMTPIYPPFQIYAAGVSLVLWLVFRQIWMAVLCIIFLILTFPYLTYFNYLMFYAGLRKAKYKGSIKLINYKQMVEIFINNNQYAICNKLNDTL